MNKKSIAIIAIAIVLLGAGWSVHLLTSKPTEKTEIQVTPSQAQVVSVDDVVNEPEKFTGIIGVEGTITSVDAINATFILGCEDACIIMPVQFKGAALKEGMNVIAYGEVKKTDEAKYLFVAQEVKSR